MGAASPDTESSSSDPSASSSSSSSSSAGAGARSAGAGFEHDEAADGGAFVEAIVEDREDTGGPGVSNSDSVASSSSSGHGLSSRETLCVRGRTHTHFLNWLSTSKQSGLTRSVRFSRIKILNANSKR